MLRVWWAGVAAAILLLAAEAPDVERGLEAYRLLTFVGVVIAIMLTMVLVPRIIIGYSGLMKWREIEYEAAFMFTVLAYAGGLLTMLGGLIIIGQWVVGLQLSALMALMILLYLLLCTLWALRGFKMPWGQALTIALSTGILALAMGAGFIWILIWAFGKVKF